MPNAGDSTIFCRFSSSGIECVILLSGRLRCDSLLLLDSVSFGICFLLCHVLGICREYHHATH